MAAVAIVVLVWCALSVPFALAAARLMRSPAPRRSAGRPASRPSSHAA